MTDDALTDEEYQQLERWLLHIDAGNLSDAQYVEMDEWLRVSDVRRDRFAELSVVWFGSAAEHTQQEPSGLFGAPSAIRRRWLAVAASIVLVCAALYTTLQTPNADLNIPSGPPRQQTLADGTVITAAPGTVLDLAFDETLRHLKLAQGKIYIRAAEDTQRPLRVSTTHGVVEVVGTVFGVEVNPANTLVGVTSGVVSVQGKGFNPLLISAGQTARFNRQSVSPGSVANALYTWVDGMLTLDDVPLSDALKRMNRYSSRRLITLSTPPDVNVSAVIAIDTVDEALIELAAQHQLTVLELPGFTIVY